MAPRRGEQREFDPVQISPSRVNSYLSCGVAFERKYIQGEPEEMSGSAALFGSVVHHALEKWAINRGQDLVSLMASAWIAETEGTAVNDFIGAYQAIAVEVLRAEKDAADEFELKNGRETKAVRMTGAFKKSAAARKEWQLLQDWLPRLRDESPWRFNDRDPLPALYNESLILAKKYAERWGHLPPALSTEFGFDYKWNGFLLNGYIDSIEPLLSEDGEITGLLVLDYKTYRAEPAPMKDWRQMVMYDVAVRGLAERDTLPAHIGSLILSGIPLYVGCDFPRMLTRKYWEISEADHAQLLRELTMYTNAVHAKVFLPAEKGRNPDFCPYPESCCLVTKGEGTATAVEVNQ